MGVTQPTCNRCSRENTFMGSIESPKATLQLLGDEGKEQTWPLAGKSTFRIGRVAASDIMLPFAWVSRQHAMIQVEENFGHNIIDMGSANGTFVNGRKVYTPTRLSSGDHVKIGNSELLFQQDDLFAVQGGADTESIADETVAFLQKDLVTLLVCDIRGFTPLSEEVGAECISEFLALWTKKVDGIVQKNGGQIDKFIGDAVLAVWPSGDSFDAVAKAMLSALEISVWTRKLGSSVTGISRQLKIGAALNTGEAVMGNIGVDGQRDFTIVGDVVNVTFRLEQMTSRQKLDLILGERTFNLLREADKFFSSKTCTVKGKVEVLTVYISSFSSVNKYLSRWKDLLKS